MRWSSLLALSNPQRLLPSVLELGADGGEVTVVLRTTPNSQLLMRDGIKATDAAKEQTFVARLGADGLHDARNVPALKGSSYNGRADGERLLVTRSSMLRESGFPEMNGASFTVITRWLL